MPTRVPASSMSFNADASIDVAGATSSAWVSHDGVNFYRNHLLLPLAAALAASVLLMVLHGDFWLADHLFALQGHAWKLKSHLVTETIIHVGGKRLSLVAWLLVLAAAIGSCFGSRFVRWRRPLAYLALTTGLASLLVSGLKATSGMDCPWDLLRYGGDRAFIGWFDWRPESMPAGRCFPAGHSSGGYAWVTLYFFFLVARPRLRWVGLTLALVVGTTFGISQQLRGAHFLSHDMWTLTICWLTALAGYLVFFRHRRGSESALPDSVVLGVEQ